MQQLRVGAGAQFRSEGILAITKALLENRVGYFADYQGGADFPPMDVLADAADILAELGVHFESSANEAAASAALATSVIYPARGAVTFKSTDGDRCCLRRAVESVLQRGDACADAVGAS